VEKHRQITIKRIHINNPGATVKDAQDGRRVPRNPVFVPQQCEIVHLKEIKRRVHQGITLQESDEHRKLQANAEQIRKSIIRPQRGGETTLV
jgi:hypothetical protein